MAQSSAAPSIIAASNYTVVSSDAQPTGNVVGGLAPNTFYSLRVVATLASGKTTTGYIQVETPADPTQGTTLVTATELRSLAASISTAGLPSMTTLTTYATYLSTYLPEFNINTPARIAAFLAQAAGETNGFRTLAASSGGMYRGRGLLMFSGAATYAAISSGLNLGNELVTNPNMLASAKIAAQAAAYYWGQYIANGQANTLADELSVSAFQQTTTDMGGPGAEAKRELYYQHALQIVYLGMLPGETLNAVNGAAASTLSGLLGSLTNPSNQLGSTVTLTVTSSRRQFNRVVVVGDMLGGGNA
jgi:predicted chitinase